MTINDHKYQIHSGYWTFSLWPLLTEENISLLWCDGHWCVWSCKVVTDQTIVNRRAPGWDQWASVNKNICTLSWAASRGHRPWTCLSPAGFGAAILLLAVVTTQTNASTWQQLSQLRRILESLVDTKHLRRHIRIPLTSSNPDHMLEWSNAVAPLHSYQFLQDIGISSINFHTNCLDLNL